MSDNRQKDGCAWCLIMDAAFNGTAKTASMLFDGVLGRTHPTFRYIECSTLPLMTHSLVWGRQLKCPRLPEGKSRFDRVGDARVKLDHHPRRLASCPWQDINPRVPNSRAPVELEGVIAAGLASTVPHLGNDVDVEVYLSIREVPSGPACGDSWL